MVNLVRHVNPPFSRFGTCKIPVHTFEPATIRSGRATFPQKGVWLSFVKNLLESLVQLNPFVEIEFLAVALKDLVHFLVLEADEVGTVSFSLRGVPDLITVRWETQTPRPPQRDRSEVLVLNPLQKNRPV